ncbi:aldose 1-epimerase family protein [Leifsonia sp. PS1209]|uniref:aldose 1-epimerase family protein n=1 Tax=Leifsonia sp. PS1209 TaxID=2724914 RepID=UPI001442D7A4|nr:aldose 1-epimerase family protein [Leifsonia sp. PS1209]QIZ99545.1 aldose 1-epimerase family protein [Leifsonia sp. PS1209]
MHPPTGTQYDIVSGDLTATVTQVAAGLRTLRLGGVDLTEPFPVEATPPSGCGIVLVPWPNRVKDAAWEFDGKTQRLAVTEPARGNAIHGLLRYRPYDLVERTASSVTQSAAIFPELGYPFQLATTVRHEVGPGGLTVTHTIENLGSGRAPVAIGAHPYLRVGDVPTADLTLTVGARTHLDVDDRLNLVGESPVAGTPFDLSDGRLVGELDLDDGFADLPVIDGEVAHTVSAPDGRRVVLWADPSFGYLQLYTSRTLATKPTGDVALAVEPMTAPANALNTGRGLRWLEPGESWSAVWGIRHDGF